jgi:hypothetical protein
MELTQVMGMGSLLQVMSGINTFAPADFALYGGHISEQNGSNVKLVIPTLHLVTAGQVLSTVGRNM